MPVLRPVILMTLFSLAAAFSPSAMAQEGDLFKKLLEGLAGQDQESEQETQTDTPREQGSFGMPDSRYDRQTTRALNTINGQLEELAPALKPRNAPNGYCRVGVDAQAGEAFLYCNTKRTTGVREYGSAINLEVAQEFRHGDENDYDIIFGTAAQPAALRHFVLTEERVDFEGDTLKFVFEPGAGAAVNRAVRLLNSARNFVRNAP